ncbi:Rieske (2Fe-2S) protein [Dactylosporangium sp. CA-092794]|uniref:Rieske (2Fe-2S) protein n=1 Tax=Dactylosporangium sp. CA-092794 TaxID=3239929 RepID=UPI003D8E02C6
MTDTTRRTFLAGAGAIGLTTALAGCAAYGETGADAAAPGGAPGALAKTGDIPVGGGKVLGDEKLVVTQPAAGTFKCFTAVCTHAGCVVSEVAGGTINCPCHGSKFKLDDGAVAAGPAKKPLAEVPITVTGDAIAKA